MKNDIFANLINRLIEVEPTKSPLISCFVNLEHPRSDYFQEFESQAALVARRLSDMRGIDFVDALEEIEDYLDRQIKPSSKSVAIYSRWGDQPVFLPMQFEVPLQTQFIVDELPHIYPLIELKDTYHRFVIAILTEGEARILENESREQLVRLAIQSGVPIETVNRNETMVRLGGVGCLLRYLPSEMRVREMVLAA